MGLEQYYSGKNVLVTGGAGTIGKELIKQILRQQPRELRVLDNSEEGIFQLDHLTAQHDNVNVILGDVRDEHKMNYTMADIDFVFHAAALKHVAICEKAPFDAVMTNIIGLQNIIRAATNNQVKRVIFTSTDKAVNPTNVMGTSKLMGERLMTAANNYARRKDVVFSSTRFGNVLASRGSVVQVFFDQIKMGGPLTLTDATMTRFIMTIEESVRLVLAAGRLAKGGEVFVTKMPAIRIQDLAEVMIEILAPKFGYTLDDIEIITVGPRPGEKSYEELMTVEEAGRALELEDLFAILPAFRPLYKEIDYSYSGQTKNHVNSAYDSSSQKHFTKSQLRKYIIKNRTLDGIEGMGNGNQNG